MVYALYLLLAIAFLLSGFGYLIMWKRLRTRRSDPVMTLLSFLLCLSFGFYAFEKDSVHILLVERLVDVGLAVVVLYNLRRLLQLISGKGPR